MKKSLLAVAVAAALPAAAFAQTNVQLYGIGDLSVGVVDRGTGRSNAIVVQSGVQSTSRWGIRGTEDLGGGLSAVFNLEAGVLWDTGANDADYWQRRAVVGLAGGFGTVVLGRDYTPGFTAGGTGDVMGYGLFGNWLQFTAANPGVVAGGITTRASNGIHYVSPSWGGLVVRAMFASGERDVSPKSIGNMYGVSGIYTAGPLRAALYYQEGKVADGTGSGSNKEFGVGGQYSFGAFRVSANFGVGDPVGGNNKLTGLALGAGLRLGPGELLVQVMRVEKDQAGGDGKGTGIGVAYVHPLSKRTNLYATLGTMRNNDAGGFALRASAVAYTPAQVGDDPKALAFGIRHTF